MATSITLDLVGVTEIAEMLDVNRVTVSKWRSAGVLPEPDGELNGARRLRPTPLWLRSTITAWASKTGRRLA